MSEMQRLRAERTVLPGYADHGMVVRVPVVSVYRKGQL